MNNNVITELKVRFSHDEMGFCRDVFETATGITICRLFYERINGKEYVGWYTRSSWGEPEFPIKVTLPIYIIDKDNSIIATEQNRKIDGEFFGDKKFPFSWEKDKLTDQEMITLFQKIYLQ